MDVAAGTARLARIGRSGPGRFPAPFMKHGVNRPIAAASSFSFWSSGSARNRPNADSPAVARVPSRLHHSRHGRPRPSASPLRAPPAPEPATRLRLQRIVQAGPSRPRSSDPASPRSPPRRTHLRLLCHWDRRAVLPVPYQTRPVDAEYPVIRRDSSVAAGIASAATMGSSGPGRPLIPLMKHATNMVTALCRSCSSYPPGSAW